MKYRVDIVWNCIRDNIKSYTGIHHHGTLIIPYGIMRTIKYKANLYWKYIHSTVIRMLGRKEL